MVEIIGNWTKLHSDELHDLYFSPNNIRLIKSKRIGLARHVTNIGEKTRNIKDLGGKLEIKRPIGRLWCGMKVQQNGS
jgi:hypothetical protein